MTPLTMSLGLGALASRRQPALPHPWLLNSLSPCFLSPGGGI